jgi:hypothetical protein
LCHKCHTVSKCNIFNVYIYIFFNVCSNKLFAIEMAETSPIAWAFICFLAVLNFLRIEFDFRCHDQHQNDDHHYDGDLEDGHRLLEGDDGAELVVSESCAEYTSMYFLVCGWCLLVYGVLVSCITWRSKVQLMQVIMY